MKNRTRSGLLLLCLGAGLLLQSCKKEGMNFPENPATFQEDSTFSTPEDLSDLPDESLSNTNNNEYALTAPSITAGTRKNLLFNFGTETSTSLTSFANSSTSQWASLQKYASYSATRTNGTARTGSYAVRYELRKTDALVGSGKRVETCRYTKGEPLGKLERWYGASYYLPSDFATDVAPEILTQWHTNIGSPPLALYTQNGTWRIVRKGSLQTVIGSYTKAKWTDFVFHVIWSTATDGLIEVWKDGAKVYSFRGATMYAGTDAGAYMRTGIYKWPWNPGSKTYVSSTTKRVVYIDDVRIGNQYATYADVAPGSY